MVNVLRTALVSLLLAGVGCSPESVLDPNPCAGTFEGSVSGSGNAPNATFSGCSRYSTDFLFSLMLGNEGTIAINASGPRPATGTHAIGGADSGQPGFSASFRHGPNNDRFFLSESGTLTVTESIPGRLKGSLTMTVRESGVSTPAVATVTATFDATCRANGLTTC